MRSVSSLKLVASLPFLLEMLFLLTIEIPLSTSFLLPRQQPLRRARVLLRGDAGITPSVPMALFLDQLPPAGAHLHLPPSTLAF